MFLFIPPPPYRRKKHESSLSKDSSTPPAPAPVAKILKALEPHAVSEESLYLAYSQLDPWKRADLSKFFGEEDDGRLFRRVCRPLL
jgi:hypothetical protein